MQLLFPILQKNTITNKATPIRFKVFHKNTRKILTLKLLIHVIQGYYY